MDFTNNYTNLSDHFLDFNTDVGDIFEIDPQLIRTMDHSIDMTVNAAGRAVSGNSHLSMSGNIQAGLTDEQTRYIARASPGTIGTNSHSYGNERSSRSAADRSHPLQYNHQASKRRRISSKESSELDDLDEILRSFTQQSTAGSSSMHSQQILRQFMPNAGSSSMHTQPVLDYSAQKVINEGVECFYRVAYMWFDMVPNFRRRRGEVREQACKALDTNESRNSSQCVSRKVIARQIQSEMEEGNNLTKGFMESWSRTLLRSNCFKFLCPSCDGLFRSSELFENHLIKVSSGKIRCPYSCGKDLARFDSIETHLKLVHKINRSKPAENGAFQCEERGCGMTFDTAAGLRTHKGMLHYRQERRCRMCKKDFANKDIMAAHLLTVHGLKDGEPRPFSCDVAGCESRFGSQKGVDKHKALTHKIYSSNPRSRFRCTEKGCGRGFITAEGLRNHLQKKHGQ